MINIFTTNMDVASIILDRVQNSQQCLFSDWSSGARKIVCATIGMTLLILLALAISIAVTIVMNLFRTLLQACANCTCRSGAERKSSYQKWFEYRLWFAHCCARYWRKGHVRKSWGRTGVYAEKYGKRGREEFSGLICNSSPRAEGVALGPSERVKSWSHYAQNVGPWLSATLDIFHCEI